MMSLNSGRAPTSAADCAPTLRAFTEIAESDRADPTEYKHVISLLPTSEGTTNVVSAAGDDPQDTRNARCDRFVKYVPVPMFSVFAKTLAGETITLTRCAPRTTL
eukprot:976700-Alexandrium_andersonii.AAC.1